MRPTGNAAELEARRLRAVVLLRDGKSTTEVARLIGVDVSSVKRWKRAAAEGGSEALAAKPNRGRPPRLTPEQKQELAQIVRAGPLAAGFRNNLWMDLGGTPMSDAAKMTERIRRPNYSTLEIEITVDDPKVFTKPWTVRMDQTIELDTELIDEFCLENEKSYERMIRSRTAK